GCGSKVAIDLNIVERGDAEVLIGIDRGRACSRSGTTGILKPGQSVRELQVQRAHAAKRGFNILGELGLQSVINRAADRLQERQRRRLWIQTGECASIAWLVEVGGRGQSKIS